MPTFHELVPLNHELAQPDFPLHVLPGVFRDMVAAVADDTQTPVDLPATILLGIGGLAGARRFRVRVSSSWGESPNLYTVSILPSGARKSPAFHHMVAPVVAVERELKQQHQLTWGPRADQKDLLAKLLEKTKAEWLKAKGPRRAELDRELADLRNTLDDSVIPAAPQLFADDVTAESLVILLAEQGGVLGVISPEGDFFDILAGRYQASGQPNVGAILKAYSNEAIRVNRVTRGANEIAHARLTLILTVQPGVIRDLRAVGAFKERGVLARLLYTWPANLVGFRAVDARPVPEALAEAYHAAVRSLFLAPGSDTLVDLWVGEHAERLLRDFMAELEPQLAPGARLARYHMVDWGGKLAGTIVRLSGILHSLTQVAESDVAPTVGRREMEAAIALGRYYLSHAMLVYYTLGGDPVLDDAVAVCRWIHAHQHREFSHRYCQQQLKKQVRFREVRALTAALDRLVTHGYLAKVPVDQGGRGRPAGPRYVVNPAALELIARHSQQTGLSGDIGGAFPPVDI